MTTISATSGASSAWSTMNTPRTGSPHGGMDPAKLFAKVDADGSGGVDSSELQTMLDKMAERSGRPGSTNAADAFSKMDSNGDGSLDKDELAAGMKSLRQTPSSTMEFAQQRLEAGGGPPPGPPPGGPPPTTSSSGNDPLDTNGDGVVSAEELAAGSSSTASTDGVAAGKGLDLAAFADMVLKQYTGTTSGQDNTLSWAA